MIQLDTENGDLNLSSEQTVLTHALAAAPAAQHLRAEIRAGDGSKDIAGEGVYRIRATVGGVEVFRSDVLVASGVTRRVFDVELMARASETVALLLTGLAADTDVDVTAYLYLAEADLAAINGEGITGNNATLKLKSLDIRNTAGDALYLQGSSNGAYIWGQGNVGLNCQGTNGGIDGTFIGHFGTTPKGEIEAEAADALQAYYLDLLIATDAGTEPTAGSFLDLIMNKDGNQTFSRTTDSLEALGEQAATILADTGELQTDWADGGRLDELLDAAAGYAFPANFASMTVLATGQVYAYDHEGAEIANPADVHTTVTPAYARQSSRRAGGIIHLPEDSNETLAWHLTDSDGADVDLTGYTDLDLEVYAASGNLLFERTLAGGGLVIDSVEHGRVTVTFTPDNLEAAGTCKYEFWGTQEGGAPTCLARGTLIIEPTFGPSGP